MSIRIQNDTVTGGAAPTRPTEQSYPAGGQTGVGGAGGSSRGPDHLEISSLSQVIRDANTAHNAGQAARVNQLAAQYRSGRYTPDSTQVSRAMIAHALSGPENS